MTFAWDQYRNDGNHAFTTTLRELKRHGCVLLITGAVSESVTLQAIRRLSGDPRYDRKQVIVSTQTTMEAIDSSLPAGMTRNDPTVRVIDITDGSDTKLDFLRGELIDAVSHFDDDVSGLAPAELRTSIDSLEGLLEANDCTALRRFLRTVTALVRGVNGIGHVHLPLSDDSPVVSRLSPLFDARIELRQRDSLVAEHRWHVPGAGVSTTWTKL